MLAEAKDVECLSAAEDQAAEGGEYVNGERIPVRVWTGAPEDVARPGRGAATEGASDHAAAAEMLRGARRLTHLKPLVLKAGLVADSARVPQMIPGRFSESTQ